MKIHSIERTPKFYIIDATTFWSRRKKYASRGGIAWYEADTGRRVNLLKEFALAEALQEHEIKEALQE